MFSREKTYFKTSKKEEDFIIYSLCEGPMYKSGVDRKPPTKPGQPKHSIFSYCLSMTVCVCLNQQRTEMQNGGSNPRSVILLTTCVLFG